jgi:hypothetical protein
LITVAGFALTHLPSLATSRGQERQFGNYPGAGVLVWAELRHLWLPESLIGLAERQPELAVLRSHRELHSVLKRLGEENLWYALTIRCHQVNGDVSDITFIRHPYHDVGQFQEFLAILAKATRNSPRQPAMGISKATLHLIPGDQLAREPREIMEELISSTDADGLSRASG